MLKISSQFITILKNNWPLLLACVITIVLLVWISPKFIKMQDEGMLTSSAMAITEGKVLYRDVFEFWPPLSIYILAGVFNLFDISVVSLRLLASLCILINLAWFYLIINKMRQGRLFEVLSLISYLVVSLAFVGMSHHLFGQMFMLLTMLTLSQLITSQKHYWAWLSGVAVGLCILSMQFEGLAAFLLCGMTLLAYYLKPLQLKVWLGVALGSMIPITVVVGYFWLQESLSSLMYATVIFPLTQYNQVNNSLAPMALFSEVVLIGGLAWYILRDYKTPILKLWITATIIILLLIFGTNNNSLVVRFAYFPAVIWLSCAIKLAMSRLNSGHGQPIFMKKNLVELMVIVLLVITAISPTALRIMLETAGSWRNIALATDKINAPAGTMYARPEQAKKAQVIVDYVHNEVKATENVYFGPYAGYYNFLTRRKSPIGYSQLTPGYNPDWMFQQAVHQLKVTKTRHLVFLPQESWFRFHTDNPLSQFVMNNYQVVQHLPHATLLSSKRLYQYTYTQQLNNSPSDAIWQLK